MLKKFQSCSYQNYVILIWSCELASSFCSLFLIFLNFERKRCEKAVKDNFDQQMMSGAHVSWSKKSTKGILNKSSNQMVTSCLVVENVNFEWHLNIEQQLECYATPSRLWRAVIYCGTVWLPLPSSLSFACLDLTTASTSEARDGNKFELSHSSNRKEGVENHFSLKAH